MRLQSHANPPASGGKDETLTWRRSKDPKEPRNVCTIQAICQTCPYINHDYLDSLKTKFERDVTLLKQFDLLEEAKILAPSPSPRPLEYRTHAKLAIRSVETVVEEQRRAATEATDRRFALGLFRRGSHALVDIETCPLHRASINRFMRDIRPVLDRSSLTPYEEPTHSGLVRYTAIRASHLTEELMVTFVVTEDCASELKKVCLEMRRLGHKISSAHMNLNPEPGNAIMGDETRHLVGAKRLRESLCDFDFEIGPTSFFQVNPWMAAMIYRRIEALAGVGRGQVAWDLYSGTGTISMVLARQGYRVLGIEENPQAGRDAQYNITRNELPSQPFFLSGRVENLMDTLPTWSAQPGLILANPSRRGMDASVCESLAFQLSTLEHTRLLYLSCEAETLVRDLNVLRKSGLIVKQIEAYDMFPFTDKLEWIAVAEKA